MKIRVGDGGGSTKLSLYKLQSEWMEKGEIGLDQ